MSGISTMFGGAYHCLVRAANYLQSPLLLIIRVYWGWQFAKAGFGKFGNIDGVASSFNSIGIMWPYFNAYLVAFVELIGGLMLLVGLFARFPALVLSIVMIVALFTAHADATTNLLQNPEAFFAEKPFLFLYASLLVLAFGPGLFSLDALMKKGNSCSNEC